MSSTRSEQRAPQRRTPEITLKDYDEDNQFYIDPSIIPEGMSYEWKRYTIRGKEDNQYQAKLRQKGYWSAVPASRHPQLAGFGVDGDQPIINEDMILMERPIELTEERLKRNDRKAKQQVNDKLAELEMTPRGTMERDKRHIKVKRSVEIPED